MLILIHASVLILTDFFIIGNDDKQLFKKEWSTSSLSLVEKSDECQPPRFDLVAPLDLSPLSYMHNQLVYLEFH